MIELNLAFVFQLVNFLVLVLLLNVFLYKPIRKMLDERAENLTGARERTSQVDREVEEKVALYEARHKEVMAQANAERATLRKGAMEEESAIIDAARKEAAASLATIKERVAKESADARQLLAEQARSLSLDICQKVLGRSV